MDYKKAFEKLVEQIETERGWAEEELADIREFEIVNGNDRVQYNRGMCFAYRSIAELALKMMTGKFDFEEES